MFRDRTAIVGVGYTELSKNSGVSTLTLALQAISAATADAGLSVKDIDGVATHRIGDSVQTSIVLQAIGLRDARFWLDQSGGGSASHTIVGSAALAVASGMADCVVCWRALNSRSEVRMGGTGTPTPDLVDYQYQTPYGYVTPPQHFAMHTRAYMDEFGVTAEDLGRVAINQRLNASMNERAMMRSPITMDDYLASRWIVEPLRLFDCCLETDAAIAVIVTSAERARDLRRPPVLISGATWGGGHNLYSNGRTSLSTSAAAEASKRLYSVAGVGADEVDVACIYDAFTPLVLIGLEDYGFCKKGEAAGFVADGNTTLTGALPVNPHGGHLSEGYVHGINHIAEAVSQLRGDSGPRQIAGASVALSTGQPGFMAGCSSALLLRGDS